MRQLRQSGHDFKGPGLWRLTTSRRLRACLCSAQPAGGPVPRGRVRAGDAHDHCGDHVHLAAAGDGVPRRFHAELLLGPPRGCADAQSTVSFCPTREFCICWHENVVDELLAMCLEFSGTNILTLFSFAQARTSARTCACATRRSTGGSRRSCWRSWRTFTCTYLRPLAAMHL